MFQQILVEAMKSEIVYLINVHMEIFSKNILTSYYRFKD